MSWLHFTPAPLIPPWITIAMFWACVDRPFTWEMSHRSRITSIFVNTCLYYWHSKGSKNVTGAIHCVVLIKRDWCTFKSQFISSWFPSQQVHVKRKENIQWYLSCVFSEWASKRLASQNSHCTLMTSLQVTTRFMSARLTSAATKSRRRRELSFTVRHLCFIS